MEGEGKGLPKRAALSIMRAIEQSVHFWPFCRNPTAVSQPNEGDRHSHGNLRAGRPLRGSAHREIEARPARRPYRAHGGARYDALTVNDLCERADTSRGTFYNHFRDKDGLLAVLEDEVMADLDALQERMQSITLADMLAFRRDGPPAASSSWS